MSAEVLRKAAVLMRERATKADALRFWPADAHDGMDAYSWEEMVSDLPGGDALNAFVESWHPAVALAVADWLDHVHANVSTYNARNHECAFAVARAYLGEQQ